MLKLVNTILATILGIWTIWKYHAELPTSVIVLSTAIPVITAFVKDSKQYFATPAILMLYGVVLLIY